MTKRLEVRLCRHCCRPLVPHIVNGKWVRFNPDGTRHGCPEP